jgi:hypothetical protein
MATTLSNTFGIEIRSWTPPYSLPSSGQAVAIETITIQASHGFQSVRPSPMGANEYARSLCGSYGSGVFCENYSTAGAFVSVATGGHGHPDLTDAVGFDFTTGAWFRVANAAGVANRNQPGYNEVTESTGTPYYEHTGVTAPVPPHPYSCAVYIPPANGGGTKGSFAYGARGSVGQGASFAPSSHRFDLATGVWSRLAAGGSNIADGVLAEYRSVFDPVTSRIYVVPWALHYFDYLPYVRTDTGSTYQSSTGFTAPIETGSDGVSSGISGAVLDPQRRLIVRGLQRKIRALDLSTFTGGWQLVTLTNSTLLPNRAMGGSELVYHPTRDAFYHLPSTGGQTLYKITPPASNPFSNPWVVSTQTISGATLHPHGNGGDANGGADAHKCLMYVPAIDRLAWCAFGTHTGFPLVTHPMTLINPT